MERHYTNERNHQILISLLKAHNISKVVASPGTTNSVFIGSIQHDPYFTIYSSVDERSAAYMACGLSYESGEPVIISCTGATAARNYMSGATEAYYSKMPILILTSSQPNRAIGHLTPQVTDRTSPPNDVCKISIELPTCNDKADECFCEIQANKALTELRRHGGGPVHLNLITTYSYNEKTALTATSFPDARVIRRISQTDVFPVITGTKNAIFVGSHKKWTPELTESVDRFCETNNAVVLCDHTSNYKGKYGIPFALVINQASLNRANTPAYTVDILIHIGEVTGEEGAPRMIKSKETWRVSEDGEIRDYFKNMSHVFEMPETLFFTHYANKESKETLYYDECIKVYNDYACLRNKRLDEMSFSNTWIAQRIAPQIPDGSTVVLSILNTLRVWNYAEFKPAVNVYCPLGGFGIDGASSLTVGASLANANKLYFGITGDLAFFYDLNSLGNRHIGSNLRILLVNNGLGFEFKKCYAMAYRLLEDEVEPYVAAAGHFGKQSSALVRHYAEDLGFEYLAASNKEEFEKAYQRFVSPEITEMPIVFECFVSAEEESTALNVVQNRD
ncbi:thiamine pyrophosphate-binding protein [uncultured Prevotella sp.]|uniref:thiamine pyrophosphate-binding protein n=1 Tax=uncultured Prevotella sp. TaxID=159272 RepID=UPI0025E0F12F|nr:thiamine pyrophosphate-binding protein [uncultured Prevotella sp.]